MWPTHTDLWANGKKDVQVPKTFFILMESSFFTHFFFLQIPCKHVFCYDCAVHYEKKCDKLCPGWVSPTTVCLSSWYVWGSRDAFKNSVHPWYIKFGGSVPLNVACKVQANQEHLVCSVSLVTSVGVRIKVCQLTLCGSDAHACLKRPVLLWGLCYKEYLFLYIKWTDVHCDKKNGKTRVIQQDFFH